MDITKELFLKHKKKPRMTLNTFDCIYYVISPCWDIMWLYKVMRKQQERM